MFFYQDTFIGSVIIRNSREEKRKADRVGFVDSAVVCS